MNFEEYAKIRAKRVDTALADYLECLRETPSRLHNAMVYSLLNGGKKIRPLLVYATGDLLNCDVSLLDIPACAVEMIHSYSLIHDDLPAMDDADLRRGQPSCHLQFDEATAILTGDALLPLALQIITDNTPAKFNAEQAVEMIALLVKVSGAEGMAGGQVLDLALHETPNSLAAIENLYQRKTGALIQASVQLAAITAQCSSDKINTSLLKFGSIIGLAFQIQDDIIDIECHTETLGKTQGKDHRLNKMTYPVFSGIENAKLKVNELYHSALACLDIFGEEAKWLRAMARFLVERDC